MWNHRIAEQDTDASAGADERYWIASLARGLAVLAAFSPGRPELSLSDLAEAAGVTKASAHRIGHTLTELGFLLRNPKTRGYRLSVRALNLGLAALAGLGLPEIAQPYLEQLAEATGEIVNLSVLDDTEIVYVGRIASTQLISVNLHVGSRLPAYCTSMGRAMLAFLPDEEARDILERSTRQVLTTHTQIDLDGLHAELRTVREQGYAVNDQELALGHRSAAAPLTNADGRVVGALNVSVPGERVSLAQLTNDLVPAVRSTARQVSALLGPGVGMQRFPGRSARPPAGVGGNGRR